MDETSAGAARTGDAGETVEQELTRLLIEETQRIQGDTAERRQQLADEAIVLGKPGPAHMALPKEDDSAAAQDAEPAVPQDNADATRLTPADADGPADEPAASPERRVPAASRDLAASLPEVDESSTDADGLAQTVVVQPAHPSAPAPSQAVLRSQTQEQPADHTAARTAAQTVPGVIPVDETVLRPLAQDDPNRYLRRTRDYDHDAQSANVVAGAGNFDTIVEHSSDREVRRDPYARSSRRGDAPGEGNSRSKLRPFLAILLVALVLGGGAAVLAYGMELWGGKSVPYVVGDTQANAEAKLAEKGMKVRVEAEPADDAIGKVLSQDPESGTRLPEGSKVTIVVATNRTMPEVVGLSQAEAEEVLKAAGAENIEIHTKASGKEEGTVLSVSPEEGAAFVSRSPVILTVAIPYTVPDVIGKKEADALDALKDAGLKAEVSYVVSDQTVRTVVKTSPGPGETISEGGTVKVEVSSPYPTDIHHLAEFFSHSSQDVDAFLLSKGFSFDKGGIDNLGNAVQTYTSSDQGNLTFSSQPYLRSLKLPSDGSSNVLSTGAPIAGVRLDCPGWMLPSGFERADLESIATDCGLKGLSDTCNNSHMTVPAGAKKISATFSCASGEMGDLVWTVLAVSGGGSTRASVTCAKKDLYKASDLQPFGGSLCQYVAYQEVYLSSEYQVKEEKTDDKKEGEKDDKKDGTAEASGEGNNG